MDFWIDWTMSTWFPHIQVGSPTNCYVYVLMLILISKLKKKYFFVYLRMWLFNMYIPLFMAHLLCTKGDFW